VLCESFTIRLRFEEEEREGNSANKNNLRARNVMQEKDLVSDLRKGKI
jgi:hypothetical protein